MVDWPQLCSGDWFQCQNKVTISGWMVDWGKGEGVGLHVWLMEMAGLVEATSVQWGLVSM